MFRKGFSSLSTTALAVGLSLLAANGCKSTVDDNTITNGVRSALSSDPTINGQPVQVAVQNGVVTLNGNVSDRTASSVAAQDAARVKGVREVVNNLQVAGLAAAPTVTTPAAPMNPQPATPEERRAIERHEPLPPRAPITRQPAPAPAPVTTATVPPPPAPAPMSSAPPPPPPPVVRNVNLAAGATIPVRITETLDSETTQPGQSFSGVITHDITSEGYVVIPAGSPVSGRVVDARDAGHFSGHSLLSVELTSVRRRGQPMPLHTDPYTVEGKNRGTNTAEKAAGGAAVGAILGGIFGGGKGAAIGAAAGGSAGAGANAITRGQQVQIPSESVVRFRLTNPITVQTTEHASDREDMPSSTLQTR